MGFELTKISYANFHQPQNALGKGVPPVASLLQTDPVDRLALGVDVQLLAGSCYDDHQQGRMTWTKTLTKRNRCN